MNILVVISLGKKNNSAVNNPDAFFISQLAKINPEHQYLLCLPQQGEGVYEETFNLRMVFYRECIFSFITKFRIQKIIQDIKPDVCICADEAVAISSKIPLYRWITRALTNNHKRFFKKPHANWFLSENQDTFWQHQFSQHQIAYTVINPLLPSIALIADSEKYAFKQNHTAGADFVLYNFMDIDDSDKWILLLKAYTQFKQWNKTGIQLLIGCRPEQEKKLSQILESYRLRNEVHLLFVNDVITLQNAIHASYMILDMPDEVKLTATMLCALQYGVPLIVPDYSFFMNAYQESVLYTKTEVASIASKMTLVYKDEMACEVRRKNYEELSAGGVKIMEGINF